MISSYLQQLTQLLNQIPRRYTTDNLKEMYGLIDAYDTILLELEADTTYETLVADYFDTLDTIRAATKKSTDNKASKKQKDDYFDAAATTFKNSVTDLMAIVQ
ncbi:hypothetical protein ACFOWM_00315 [Ferruginibacter yonginensis]|uniref:Uncharacterized protein n=1 Tax=Ferruginibacter yonginensis TaxID=1310416 RepID=A0ABV8QLX2_9BACT